MNNNDSYLAFANLLNDSQIFKFDGAAFQPFQSIPTQGASDVEFFVIGNNRYLAVANSHQTDNRTVVNSQIFKFDGTAFKPFQSFVTFGARDWEFFTIGNSSYLAVVNEVDGNHNFSLNSQIFKFDGTTFRPLQNITTLGAVSCKFFTIGNNSYLAFANDFDGVTYNTNSEILKFDGTLFQHLQYIETHGANAWQFFTVGSSGSGGSSSSVSSVSSSSSSSSSSSGRSSSYLAVANYFNGTSNNINSQIFKFDDISLTFQPFLAIPTHAAADWEFFTINNSMYLAVANADTGANHPNTDSVIFNWNECLL